MYLNQDVYDIYFSVIISLFLISFILYFLLSREYNYFLIHDQEYINFCRTFSLLSISYILILQGRIIYIITNMKYSLDLTGSNNLVDELELENNDSNIILFCILFISIIITILAVKKPQLKKIRVDELDMIEIP
jgi:hypothetical protein